jgi:exonuclease III
MSTSQNSSARFRVSSPTGSWHILHDPASAKGRAGVAVVSAWPAVAARTDLGPEEFDSAGRWLEADFEFETREGVKTITVVSTCTRVKLILQNRLKNTSSWQPCKRAWQS